MLKTNTHDINPKVLNWLFGIFFGLFAIGIGALIFVEKKAGDCDRSKKEFFRMEYTGKIVRTYRSKNHGHLTTVFEDGSEKTLIFDYTVWAGLRPGDILVKRKNESNFLIIRDGDTTVHKESVPDCEQFRK